MAFISVMLERPARKQSTIVNRLVGQITSGRLKPGARVPSRQELSELHGVSLVTVQKALARLQADGLLEARGRAGTFVTARPPHLCHFGLVFPHRPGVAAEWSCYYAALERAAQELAAGSPNSFGSYFGLDTAQRAKEYDRLVADIQAGRFAGLIFPFSPYSYAGTPLLDEPGIPRVAYMDEQALPQVAVVKSRWKDFVEPTLGYFADQGRRRIAVISHAKAGVPAAGLDHWRRTLTAAGCIVHDRWLLGLPVGADDWAVSLMQLLMHAAPGERPDGLIVLDDNLVPGVVHGLLQAGVDIPGDVAVVGHANFPWPTPAAAPLFRVGPDLRILLNACMTQIARSRKAAMPPPLTVPTHSEYVPSTTNHRGH